jgi:hypothetical protein
MLKFRNFESLIKVFEIVYPWKRFKTEIVEHQEADILSYLPGKSYVRHL